MLVLGVSKSCRVSVAYHVDVHTALHGTQKNRMYGVQFADEIYILVSELQIWHVLMMVVFPFKHNLYFMFVFAFHRLVNELDDEIVRVFTADLLDNFQSPFLIKPKI